MSPLNIAAPVDTVSRVVGHGPAAFDAARERLDSLRRVGHPGLWLPERITLEADGDAVARGPRAPGVDLSSLLRTRGALNVGECVAVGIDIADALAALHAAGLVHGDLSTRNVVVTPRRVVLIDLVCGVAAGERGTPGFSAPERAVHATFASDVYSLGRLLLHVASDEARARVEAWTGPLTATSPDSRPPAHEAAAALRRCAAPVPVAVPDVGVVAAIRARAQGPDEVTLKSVAGRPWRVRRALTRSARVAGILSAASVILLILIAIVSALVPDSASTAVSLIPSPTSGTASSPADAATSLTIQRFDALASGDVEGLLATTVEGSEARAADGVLAEGLASKSIRFDGLGVGVTDANVVEASGSTATVRVTYVIPAHEVWENGLSVEVEEATVSAELEIVWTQETGWRAERARSLS